MGALIFIIFILLVIVAVVYFIVERKKIIRSTQTADSNEVTPPNLKTKKEENELEENLISEED